jgi:hypothetical protein
LFLYLCILEIMPLFLILFFIIKLNNSDLKLSVFF